ncbi:DNA polymerase Y family protein [Aliiroseovarius sp. KMU-50]|uniref:DNA-directed DNA polymerase n=1 Tax=Aliiroseovarius salicola TaxID=3009082 RepID=A0ABT4VZZ5_9RHOB|nr:DNA polymerase Y family protein [Aliiroseovarius sp. KMU-50]MDA5093818.1 DNA polymerase Y family protein [Aliiroseovarius sp. KMU-50]
MMNTLTFTPEKRVISLWLPRLASERYLRRFPSDGPFAITAQEANANRVVCLNAAGEQAGLSRGMGLSDARALCPDLRTGIRDEHGDARFLLGLARWAQRYCPWVARDGADGLLLDITGSAHLMGGETALLADLRARLSRVGMTTRLGLADTRGAAWALARYGEGVAPVGGTSAALVALPVAGLRLDPKEVVTLQRLGLKTIGQLMDLPRATLGQRFGGGVLMRLDQALGDQGEALSPEGQAPHFATRLTLPEPIGLTADVMAGLERLLPQLCDRLARYEMGARRMVLICRRVDRGAQEVDLRLARPMRDPHRILPLFERGVGELDAGFGIDQMRLLAREVEALPTEQLTRLQESRQDGVADLVTRLGNRVGLENIRRFLPADSHIPERSFLVAPAAWSAPDPGWSVSHPRPLQLFPPEPIAGQGATPPIRFRWRRMALSVARATGPERIAPEWWLEDEAWQRGVRDYWRIETRQGRRLWLYHTPQNPGWFVQGAFA